MTRSPVSDELLWVAGGRDYVAADVIRRELLPYHGWVLITGAARGVDRTAELVWQQMERPYVGVPARWAAFGRRAGPARNESIATFWRPRRLLAFPGGNGTANAKRVALREGIEVVEVET